MLAIQYLLVVLMVYLVLFRFLNVEQKRAEVKWMNLASFMALGLFDVGRQLYYGYQPVRSYDTIIGLSLVFLAGAYALNGLKSWQAWVAVMITTLISSFVSMIATGFVFTLLGRNMSLLLTNATYSVIGMLLGVLLFLILYQIVKRLKLELNVNALTKRDVWMIVFFIFIFSLFVTGIYELGYRHESDLLRAVISFLALLSGVMAIYFVVYLATQRSLNERMAKREKQHELIFKQQLQHYQLMKDKEEETKVFRHNINDELDYLYDRAQAGKMDEVKNHIQKMRGKLKQIVQLTGQNTGSQAVNASWYALTHHEKYQNIEAIWSGKLPFNLLIDNRDMVLLFSNLLSNAFEAAVQVTKHRYVQVTIDVKATGLTIVIKNSYQGEIKQNLNGDLITSKSEKENHGIGTRMIRKIVEQYQGYIEFSYLEGEFTVCVAFDGRVLPSNEFEGLKSP